MRPILAEFKFLTVSKGLMMPMVVVILVYITLFYYHCLRRSYRPCEGCSRSGAHWHRWWLWWNNEVWL